MNRGRSRILVILSYLAVALLLTLMAMWIWGGGFSVVAKTARSFSYSFPSLFSSNTDELGLFQLPWQDQISIPQVPDTINYSGEVDGISIYSPSPEQRLSDLQMEYDSLVDRAQNTAQFGERSPLIGFVRVQSSGERSTEIANEYIELYASYTNTTPVSLEGWSIQSAVTRTRFIIPKAAAVFVGGVVNQRTTITLSPGERVIIHTGSSPLGVSFQENVCTGYLTELQTFTPTLRAQCPNPRTMSPLTTQSLQQRGEACEGYIDTIPSCHLPTDAPRSLGSACITYLQNTFSYNGCVAYARHRVGFGLGIWHVYLNSQKELWQNSHDVIRLLDTEGRTVDALSY